MQIRFFRAVRANRDWELNFIGERLNIRIGRSQFAIWWTYNPLICKLYGFANKSLGG